MRTRPAKSVQSLRMWLLLLVVAIPFLPFIFQQASAATRTCEHGIVVISTNDSDANLACAAAKSASQFLQEFGLGRKEPLRIEIVDLPNLTIPVGAYGCYDFASKIISVLSFNDCLRVSMKTPPYGLALTREMYSSFIVHEVGHAVAASNSAKNSLSRLAHECIAYITQLSVMTNQLRKDILNRYEKLSISSLAELSSLTYLLSPDVFAIKCYKYFLAQKDKRGFLNGLLSGEIQMLSTNVHP